MCVLGHVQWCAGLPAAQSCAHVSPRRLVPTRPSLLPSIPAPQVLYDKWVDVLNAAAEALEWEPAQVGAGLR